VQLHAVDIEPAAVRCARRNVDAGSHVYEGDLYGPLPPTLRGQVDVVVANVPYVPTKAISFLPTEARQYESTVALDGGVDGLDILRQVAKQAPGWLSSSGHFLVETSGGQASAAMKIMADYGMTGWITRSTQLDATVVVGAWRCP
jgi:release factor glutamine methyltransferase